jgi:hypothetical protein
MLAWLFPLASDKVEDAEMRKRGLEFQVRNYSIFVASWVVVPDSYHVVE